MPPPSALDAPVTEADVAALFDSILRRPLNNPAYARLLAASGISLRRVIEQMRASPELRDRIGQEIFAAETAQAERRAGQALTYRCPSDLAVTPLAMRRLLVVGSCLAHLWTERIAALPDGCPTELYLFGAELPEKPKLPIEAYDFQIVQLPLREVLPDGAFARLGHTDMEAHKALLERCFGALRHFMQRCMAWNAEHGLLTFVFAFVAPQQNMMGRLLPRYDLRNPVVFIDRLNRELAALTAQYGNAYFFDINEVLATHGRRYIQEDMAVQINHASMMIDFDYDYDTNRLDTPHRLSEVYEQRILPIVGAVWQELQAMLRSVRQLDAVKMVVIDLDDTLWRGVAAEFDADDLPTAEGWPRGFWEALRVLKRRGILLGIISQNDEARVIELWPRILGNLLALEDFAIHRIDWRPKPGKMAEILASVNLLPGNVVYIDDNPVQRAEMSAAFPGLRVLGGDPFTWRHILLWSAETQVARMTPESVRRTEMVRAQVKRETARAQLPRESFLASLNVRMAWFDIAAVTHPRFARALELINKTNQFNTTGERWTQPECVAAFAAGARFHAFEVADNYTEYGLVGVLIVDDGGIRQFVMSCRVLGLDVELTAVARIVAQFAMAGKNVEARLIETDRNLPCRSIYAKCGFDREGEVWKARKGQGALLGLPYSAPPNANANTLFCAGT